MNEGAMGTFSEHQNPYCDIELLNEGFTPLEVMLLSLKRGYILNNSGGV
jgi:hypothetical protein